MSAHYEFNWHSLTLPKNNSIQTNNRMQIRHNIMKCGHRKAAPVHVFHTHM